MPVVQDLADMYKAVDAAATVNLLAKLAVEKSYHAKLDDTRSSLAVRFCHHTWTDKISSHIDRQCRHICCAFGCSHHLLYCAVAIKWLQSVETNETLILAGKARASICSNNKRCDHACQSMGCSERSLLLSEQLYVCCSTS